MYNKILVPIDGSPASNLGFDEAIKLSLDQRAHLRILHVLNEWLLITADTAAVNIGDIQEDMRRSADALITEAQTRAHAAGVDATTALIEPMGTPVGAAILRHAEDWPADLIVCGTHGRRGVRRLVLGSDAEYIIRHTRIPVLLRRHPELGEKS
ncbi:MAG: universal stress protein [Steroidobacteraceae bacterium]